jgi:multidrug resistance efflux pump
MSLEDVRGAELTYYRYVFETESKQEAIKVATVELEKAQAILEEHQIRSGVRGIVRRIHKHIGEAVRKFDTVVTLELLPEDD